MEGVENMTCDNKVVSSHGDFTKGHQTLIVSVSDCLTVDNFVIQCTVQNITMIFLYYGCKYSFIKSEIFCFFVM